ncbi:MAG: glycoside hydrolase family 88 protein [Verrucomicrobiota bacterium JB022]|nr:glycoside hydrolase family 88 protein [Verrucomicrobiota bacterium JB022]
MLRYSLPRLASLALLPATLLAQAPQETATPSVEQLRLINRGASQPAYPVVYGPVTTQEVKEVLDRVLAYIDAETPKSLVDRETGKVLKKSEFSSPNARFPQTHFGIVSYEWGVTYAGALHAAEATGDARYGRFVGERMQLIADSLPVFAERLKKAEAAGDPRPWRVPLRNLNAPHTLDDSGAMGAAMIKARRADAVGDEIRPVIDRLVGWIAEGQFRFEDGTLARNRPMPNALWLDDLYMSVPALAQMGVLTGDAAYFDDAAKQLIQFHERMFVPEKGLFMHGWIRDMEPHPAFHWGRANGWAAMAAAELLSVLPESHPQREAVLAIYRAHMKGLAAHQGGEGLWHQLLDRYDSYQETSASAMFVYAMARGINRGWLDPLAYGPATLLGWNAVAAQVNEQGQVENTCVGTGMGFDPAFYYHRPVSVYAAHGYGPVLMAGAEMITLLQDKGRDANVNDGSAQFAPEPDWRNFGR